MSEATGAFVTPEVNPGDPGAFDFLKHALFDYEERRDESGETLYITGQVGLQETVAQVGEQIFEVFESDKVMIYDGGEGRLSLLFDEPLPDGTTIVEITLRKAD